jgi:hypothetical protein
MSLHEQLRAHGLQGFEIPAEEIIVEVRSAGAEGLTITEFERRFDAPRWMDLARKLAEAGVLAYEPRSPRFYLP